MALLRSKLEDKQRFKSRRKISKNTIKKCQEQPFVMPQKDSQNLKDKHIERKSLNITLSYIFNVFNNKN